MFGLIKRAFSVLFAYKSECEKGKQAWRSRTIWANVIAICAAILGKYAGIELSAEDSLIVLAMVNVVLRLITKNPTGFYEDE